jgi:osmotically-inducible protein OsmY
MEEIPMRTRQGSGKHLVPRQRVDVDLERRIANFLYQQRVSRGVRIRTDVQTGTVVVSGKCSSRHTKWICVECCRRVAGVVNLVDRVIVDQELACEAKAA